MADHDHHGLSEEAPVFAALDALITASVQPGRIPLIGLAGAQGSGKTYWRRRYESARAGIGGASLDDFYLTRAERQALAAHEHRLFAQRGAPGTHDLALLHARLDDLLDPDGAAPVALPCFDKARDDRAPASAWPVVTGARRAIVIDGWLLGATPASETELRVPVNAFEAERDPDALWRRAANRALAGAYQILFARFDAILFLAAPDFACVPAWRCEQEAETLGRALTPPETAAINDFVAAFERITRAMLAGARRADLTLQLDARRRVIGPAPADHAQPS